VTDTHSLQDTTKQKNSSAESLLMTERRSRMSATTSKALNGPDAWVMTYMDLVTLLLTLFIFLLLNAGDGTKGSENKENESIESTIISAEGILSGSKSPIILPDIAAEPSSSIEALKDELLLQLEYTGLNVGIEIEQKEGDLYIHFKDGILFDSGEAYFTLNAMDSMRPVINALQENNFIITVEGHTDNVPISNEQFPSNWELASARATYLVRILIEEGISPTSLRAISYASTQPLESNDSEEGRQRNRRVTLVVSENNN
jgi:chemotaxis protein MotB